jgi:hypothetical protein
MLDGYVRKGTTECKPDGYGTRWFNTGEKPRAYLPFRYGEEEIRLGKT